VGGGGGGGRSAPYLGGGGGGGGASYCLPVSYSVPGYPCTGICCESIQR